MALEEDDTLDVEDKDLRDVSTFQQLYLISKVLSEATPIKIIIFKCLME